MPPAETPLLERTAVDDDLVSVIIPCYQAATTIAEQLAALAAQTAPGRFEVIAVDNGSRDGTRQLLAAAGREHPELGLRVVEAGDVRGAGPARNAGARVARGAVLAFCDADDVVGAGWVGAVRRGVGEHGFIAGHLDGVALNEEWTRRARHLDQQDGLQEAVFSPWLPHAAAADLALRRELVEAVGGFDPECRYLEDTDLCWRVQITTGVPLVFHPEAVVHSRLRTDLAGTLGQGWRYGAAAARLRRRWASREVPAPPSAGRGGGAGWRSRLSALRRSLVPQRPWDRGALAHVLWHGGWHLAWWLGRYEWLPAPLL